MTRPRNFDDVLSKLPGACQSGASWTAPCPAPGHGTPADHLTLKDVGDRALVTCQGGRHSYEDICAALGFSSLNYKESQVPIKRTITTRYSICDTGVEVELDAIDDFPKIERLIRILTTDFSVYVEARADSLADKGGALSKGYRGYDILTDLNATESKLFQLFEEGHDLVLEHCYFKRDAAGEAGYLVFLIQGQFATKPLLSAPTSQPRVVHELGDIDKVMIFL